jgi:hypothetical protein
VAIGTATNPLVNDNVHPQEVWSPINVGLIKHIPRASRTSCATHLAAVLRGVAANPEVHENWLAMFNWGGKVLQPPKRGGKRHNLSSTIRARISGFDSDTLVDPPVLYNGASRSKCSSPDSLVAQAVSAKLEDGNVRAAIRILTSEDTPALPSDATLAKLRDKHPPSSMQDSGVVLPDPTQFTHLSVDESAVKRAVLSFPAGSSGGPDGIRPQHIKDLVQCQETGSDFLTALTAFTNMVLSGRCPAKLAPVFFGGRALALNKKAGGIRPISIGFTLRRLVSKCASSFGVNRLADYLSPVQLGVGTAGGCEAAVHATRRYLETMPPDWVMVKLDFSNAFNSLHRSDMLLAVRDRLPELYAYCFSAYANPSILYHGPFTFFSEEGPQQGDPIGPLLFSNCIHPMLLSMDSVLNCGYLDDVTLGGPVETVVRDVAKIVERGGKLGLFLNCSKCELVTHDNFSVGDPYLESFTHVPIEDVSLLGAPLFPGSVLDADWAKRCADLSRAVERLRSIGSQDALILLRASFGAPKVQHLLRCCPSFCHPALQTFDNLLRSAVQQITNSDLSDSQWIQASLPIKDGGLGIRRVSSLARSAFLASAASTLSLQTLILEDCCVSEDTHLREYLDSWSLEFGSLPDPLPSKQASWDRPGVLVDKALVESRSVSSATQKATCLAAAAAHSGDWLLAMPITSCGLRLDDETVRVAVGLRLGLNLCVPHTCRCGAMVDARGLHCFVCKRAPGRTSRHHALNDIVARAFASAGIPAAKEPNGLTRTDGKRPDGLTLIPWEAGKPLTWDVTVASTLAASYVDDTARSAGAAAELAAIKKIAKYSNLVQSHIFQPLAFENLGTMNDTCIDFINKLGNKISSVTGDCMEARFLFQRFSVTIQRFNAILLKDTFFIDTDQRD